MRLKLAWDTGSPWFRRQLPYPEGNEEIQMTSLELCFRKKNSIALMEN